MPNGNEQGSPNFLTQKFAGIPAWVFLVGAAVVGYLFLRNSSSSSGAGGTSSAGSATGGAGDTSATSGDTTIDTGAVQVTVTQSPGGSQTSGGGSHKKPPGPKPPKPRKKTQVVANGYDPNDINNIAKQNGLTETQLINMNPQLRKMMVKSPDGKSIPLIGSGAPVPRGTKLKV